MRERLLRTAFFTAVFAYIAFIFIDYREPGFVSHVLSVHIVGAVALVLALVWAVFAERSTSRSRVMPWVIGAALSFIVFAEGTAFGDFRGLLAIAVLFLPWLTSRVLLASGE